MAAGSPTHTHHQTQDTFDRFARGFHTKAGRTTLYTLAEGGNHDDSGQNNLKNRRATCYQNRTSKTLSIYIAACDADQQELVKAAGFAEEARLRNRFRDGKGWMDVLVYTLSLPDAAPPLWSKGDYYGGRKQWHAERIVSSQIKGEFPA